MVGLISDTLADGDPWESLGTAAPSSSVWDRVDPLALTKQVARSIGNTMAQYGAFDEFGRQTLAPEPSLSPSDLHQRVNLPDPKDTGVSPLQFNAPLPLSVAQSMADAKRDEILRAEASQRQPAGFGAMASNFAVGMLDPIGIAASFIPGLGEGRMADLAARAGWDLTSSAAGRTVARAAAGAATGGAAQVPLVGLRYGLSQQEQADYTMGDALTDLAMGMTIGSGLHVAIGGAGDAMSRLFNRMPAARVVNADPVARADAMRAAVAAGVEDRPIDAAAVIREAQIENAAKAGLPDVADIADRSRLAPEGERFTAEGPDGLMRLSDGATELGQVPAGIDGVEPGPIRVARGFHDDEMNGGEGIAHIEARHGDELRAAGFEGPEDFVAHVARNFDELRQQDDGTLMLAQQPPAETPNRSRNTLVTTLAKDGDGYRVITAAKFAKRYVEQRKKLWEAERQTASRPNGPENPSTSPPQEVSASVGSLDAQGQSFNPELGTRPADVNANRAPPDLFDPEALERAQGAPAPDDAAVMRQADAVAKKPPEPVPADLQKQIAEFEQQLGMKAKDEAGETTGRDPAEKQSVEPEMPPETAAAVAEINAATEKSQGFASGLKQAAACMLRGII